jgi:multidrug efflux pump subunit AcrA (membrane-fusion protein)
LSAVFGASEGKQMYVWVVKDNKAYKREVTVHAPTGEAQVIISQGLKPGEEIIIAGVNQLVEGESVKVMKD